MSGTFGVTLKLQKCDPISPTLGEGALKYGLIAGIIGLALVIDFYDMQISSLRCRSIHSFGALHGNDVILPRRYSFGTAYPSGHCRYTFEYRYGDRR